MYVYLSADVLKTYCITQSIVYQQGALGFCDGWMPECESTQVRLLHLLGIYKYVITTWNIKCFQNDAPKADNPEDTPDTATTVSECPRLSTSTYQNMLSQFIVTLNKKGISARWYCSFPWETQQYLTACLQHLRGLSSFPLWYFPVFLTSFIRCIHFFDRRML